MEDRLARARRAASAASPFWVARVAGVVVDWQPLRRLSQAEMVAQPAKQPEVLEQLALLVRQAQRSPAFSAVALEALEERRPSPATLTPEVREG